MKHVLVGLMVTGLVGCQGASSPPAPVTERPGSSSPSSAGASPQGSIPDPNLPSAEADLSVRHALVYPTRVAVGPSGLIYVTDVRVGSLFVLDGSGRTVGELKGLDRPLGVSVDVAERIYVGNHGRRNVEVYSAAGALLWKVGEGEILMPNDLAVDASANVYVADSAAHVVRSYDIDGRLRFTVGGLGEGDESFRFPSAVALSGGPDRELFVGDQGQGRIHVYGLDGSFRRAFGQAMEAFNTDWQGKLVRVQALAVDAAGRLHVADTGLCTVQVMDGQTGSYVGHYGVMGTAPGMLNLPLGLALDKAGLAWVANTGNARVERFTPAVQGGE